jgi:hypothetical protein
LRVKITTQWVSESLDCFLVSLLVERVLGDLLVGDGVPEDEVVREQRLRDNSISLPQERQMPTAVGTGANCQTHRDTSIIRPTELYCPATSVGVSKHLKYGIVIVGLLATSLPASSASLISSRESKC